MGLEFENQCFRFNTGSLSAQWYISHRNEKCSKCSFIYTYININRRKSHAEFKILFYCFTYFTVRTVGIYSEVKATQNPMHRDESKLLRGLHNAWGTYCDILSQYTG